MTAAIDVKQAVESATAYFAKLMNVSDVRLEEVEISEDDRFWRVTLSGLVPSCPGEKESKMAISGLASLFQPVYERIYKLFTVDAADGSVKSMKIRKVG